MFIVKLSFFFALVAIASAKAALVQPAFVAPYASTYNAHVINHAVAAPVVAAAAPVVASAPLVAAPGVYPAPYAAYAAHPYAAHPYAAHPYAAPLIVARK